MATRSKNNWSIDQRRRCSGHECGYPCGCPQRRLPQGLKVKGIQKGYNGLLNEEIIDMTAQGCVRYYCPWRYYSVYCPLCRVPYGGRPGKRRRGLPKTWY